MSAKPLAEAYERLKELRRQGGLQPEIRSRLGHQLRDLYDDVAGQGLPGPFVELMKRLDALGEAAAESDGTTSLVRILDIRTLADRVFGDETKAEAWLHRSNTSFSGQKPIDLLRDELGAAVVREALEQIDHGIFA
jgi:Protein of unknown function (DUF2384)/Anti-sigma factor NepR